ncbi:MAG: hypothetical protein JRF33_26880 [Deltaproteobacteria bacterium]|nr:hypothetical protein [Deltaproteobacteria bacterium]
MKEDAIPKLIRSLPIQFELRLHQDHHVTAQADGMDAVQGLIENHEEGRDGKAHGTPNF